ncbi:hypothetical protein P3T24_004400 [Paraburkholderia sp. GAS33]|uniref:hypothetical protein n=1 Tax=Paraburkholderia sp. GAS33 TaxID=3035130 RepID=UPI003D2551FF
MPVLPTLQSSQSVFNNTPLQSQNIPVDANDFGAQVGAAAQGLGQSAEQAGGDVNQVAIAKQAINNEGQANNTFATGLAPAVRAITQKFYTLQGQAAVDAQPEMSQAIQDARQAYRDSLNPAAARMFDETSLRFLNNEQDGMSRYVAQEQVKANQTASDNLVYSFKQNAADKYNDPIAFGGMLQSVAQERAQQGAVMGQSSVQVANQVVMDQSQMWVDRLRQIATKDPVAAYSMLQNGEDWTANGQPQHTDVMSQILPTQRASLIDEMKKGADIVTAHDNAAAFLAGITPPASSAGALGVRNNNFGNLKDPNTGQFQQFATPQQGIQAADSNLLAYQTKHGIDTIDGIVNRWAPQGDGNNNPTAYAATVAKATGIAVDQKVDLTDPATRTKILDAMFDVESPGWRGAADHSTLPQAPPSSPFAPANQPAVGAVTGDLAVPVANAGQVGNNAVTGLDPVAMEADLSKRAEAARAWGNAVQPNDPAYGDKMYAEVMNLGNSQINGVRTTQNAAAETLSNSIDAGKLTSMPALMADPASKAAYNLLSEKGQIAVTNMLAAPPVKLNTNNLPLYAQLKGEQMEHPDQFVKEDIIGSYGGKLPTDVLKTLIDDQANIVKGGVAQSQKAISLTGAWGNVQDIAANAGITESKDPANLTKLKGAFLISMENYQQQNGKPADAAAQRKLMAGLLVPGTQTTPGILFGNVWPNHTSMPAFESPDQKNFQAPQNDKGWTLHVDKHGNQAYVSPDGKQFEVAQ